ncbi:hypothetical protein NC652_039313 [Populus alba x Populus x berolinensis]|nr:hypothetical protein NC652_039313 [Populus alba x Populus x berolinensis]
MFTRMITITNNLNAFGRTYTNFDIMRKILRSLPKTWKAKVMTIREAKNLTKLSLKEIIISHMTHEITINKQELEEKPKKNLAIKIVHHVDSDNNDEEVEEDIAFITRQF